MNSSVFSWCVAGVLGLQSLALTFFINSVTDAKQHSVAPESARVSVDKSTVQGLTEDEQSVLLWKIESVVREIVKEEVAAIGEAKLAVAGRAGDDAEAAQPEAAVSFEQRQLQQESFANSQAVVLEAVNSGVWTRESSLQLSAYAGDLNEDQRIELIQKFHDAVGRGEIQVGPESVPVL